MHNTYLATADTCTPLILGSSPSIIQGSKACLLEDRSWSKFLWPLPSGVLLKNISLLIRNSKLEDKEWIVHTKTDWQLRPLLVHILPLASSILWISLWMWQYWKALTCRSRTPLQLLRYLMWVQNIHMLNPKQRNSWLYGIVEANMVRRLLNSCLEYNEALPLCSSENIFPWIMKATCLKSLNKTRRSH